MASYVYKQFNHSELERIQASVLSRLANWRQRWFGNTDLNIEFKNAFEVAAESRLTGEELIVFSEMQQAYEISAERLLIIDAEQFKRSFVRELCPVDGANVQDLTCSATEDLFRSFVSELVQALTGVKSTSSASKQQPQHAPLTHCYTTGSTWLSLRIALGGIEQVCLVDGGLVDPTSQLTGPVKSNGLKLGKLIVDKPLRLKALLGDVDLSIGDFQSLKSGDILIFERNFAEKVELITSAGDHVCRGGLGKYEANRAVKVLV